MTHTNNITPANFQVSSLAKSMIIGAVIGFLILCFFVFMGKADATWGKYWMIKPLLMGPFAGAVGGLVFYLLNPLRQGGWKTIASNILGVLIFIIGMWIGIVLGLNGTMWN